MSTSIYTPHQPNTPCPQATHFTHIQKQPALEFPKFDGTEVHDWFFQAENCFHSMRTIKAEKLEIASHHLTGDALKWFKIISKTKEGVPWSWPDFTNSIVTSFSPKHLDTQ